jgi:hypothetical protein
MSISQPQNYTKPIGARPQPYGVRVSLPPGDTFRKLLGADWHREHWFATRAERDAAMADMRRRHEYSRPNDAPALVFEKVENLAVSRNL